MRFLQLSDIHFTDAERTSHDPDQELRWKLRKALRRIAKDRPVDAILVAGDVAFSGRRDEYAVASTFLRDIAADLGVAPESIFVIPGNHDVDRQQTDSPAQRTLRSGLRTINNADRDIRLRTIAIDPAASALLMAPLDEYSRFATVYDCPTTAAFPCWHRSVVLDDTVELVIHGLNSALASHAHDNDTDEALIVGTVQAQFEPADGRADFALCHHPPSWIMDGDEIRRRLERTVVHVTGHVHEWGADATPGGTWLRAGALQPSRRDSVWQPHFSIIDLALDDSGIEIIVEPWAWIPERIEFEEQDSSAFRGPLPEGQLSEGRTEEIEQASKIRRLKVQLAALPAADILNAADDAGLPSLAATASDGSGTLAAQAAEAAEAIGVGSLSTLWEKMAERRNQTMENPFQ